MKRILIGILIFLVYLALVIWGAFALHLEGTRLVLFCVILGLLGALATVFVLWYMHSLDKASGKADRKSTRLNSSHLGFSYAVFCLEKINADRHFVIYKTLVGFESAFQSQWEAD